MEPVKPRVVVPITLPFLMPHADGTHSVQSVVLAQGGAQVSDSTHHPTIDEIQSVLADLARQVLSDSTATLELEVRDEILRVLDELERFIPGLDPSPDPNAAQQLSSAASAALVHGRPRIALARALRGLSCAPHHAELFYIASSACFELAAITEAVRLLAHTLWVNPGHERARREMDLLATCDDPGLWDAGEGSGEDGGGERAA